MMFLGFPITAWIILPSPLFMFAMLLWIKRDWYYRLFRKAFFYHTLILEDGEGSGCPAHKWSDVDEYGAFKCGSGLYSVASKMSIKSNGRLDLYHIKNNINPVEWKVEKLPIGTMLGEKGKAFVWDAERILHYVEGKNFEALSRVGRLGGFEIFILIAVGIAVIVAGASAYYSYTGYDLLYEVAFKVAPELFQRAVPDGAVNPQVAVPP